MKRDKDWHPVGGLRKSFSDDEINTCIGINGTKSILDTLVLNIINKRNIKVQELVHEKLKEKGFEHLIEGIKNRRFQKVCCVIKSGWAYYFADNDTDQGAFIVAIKEFDISDILKDEMNITWHENYINGI
jgi:hypothetical protein